MLDDYARACRGKSVWLDRRAKRAGNRKGLVPYSIQCLPTYLPRPFLTLLAFPSSSSCGWLSSHRHTILLCFQQDGMTSDQRSQGSIRTRHVAVCRVWMKGRRTLPSVRTLCRAPAYHLEGSIHRHTCDMTNNPPSIPRLLADGLAMHSRSTVPVQTAYLAMHSRWSVAQGTLPYVAMLINSSKWKIKVQTLVGQGGLVPSPSSSSQLFPSSPQSTP